MLAQEEIIDDEDPVPPADTTADKSELESALQTAVAEDDLAGLLKAAGVAQVRNLGWHGPHLRAQHLMRTFFERIDVGRSQLQLRSYIWMPFI